MSESKQGMLLVETPDHRFTREQLAEALDAQGFRLEREPGWYWVRTQKVDYWHPAKWRSGMWILAGCDVCLSGEAIVEIDERRIERQP